MPHHRGGGGGARMHRGGGMHHHHHHRPPMHRHNEMRRARMRRTAMVRTRRVRTMRRMSRRMVTNAMITSAMISSMYRVGYSQGGVWNDCYGWSTVRGYPVGWEMGGVVSVPPSVPGSRVVVPFAPLQSDPFLHQAAPQYDAAQCQDMITAAEYNEILTSLNGAVRRYPP
ncbi:hypothetical protein KIPB_012527 [Kipferlia bialata]|uniref:Uncharacterized protein n=1 Tax=Kipferlia bialata TaxID=797122 RepID=A0A9K3D887_9EUKA|nr:hypothetical protein KIPB_012527 [Kipferlia bialata]|eukprot:g12527.t1